MRKNSRNSISALMVALVVALSSFLGCPCLVVVVVEVLEVMELVVMVVMVNRTC